MHDIGSAFTKRFDDAVFYSRKQRQDFEEFSSTFNDQQVQEWQATVDAWKSDPVDNTDPFQEPVSGPFVSRSVQNYFLSHSALIDISLMKVRQDLNREEERQLSLGSAPLHEVSATQFLVTGLELEEAQ